MTSQVIGHFAARPRLLPARTLTAQRRPGTFTPSGECCIRCNSAYFMKGLEVPPEVVEALGGGKRPAVTITINGHSWKSRVAILRGRYLLGLSNANRQAAGVATGDDVEVEVEIDAEPRVVAEPADLPAPWTPTRPPAPPTTACPTVTSGSTGSLSKARRSPRRARGGSRRPSPCCGTRSRQGAIRRAPRPEAITTDTFETITPAMARDEFSAWAEPWPVTNNTPHVQSLLVDRLEPWLSVRRCYEYQLRGLPDTTGDGS
jgi:hypothetical protein